MQSSQDEESPWHEDGDAPPHHAEEEWTSLSTSFTTAGYRDGISAGKEAALQEGFDEGFARTGAPRGRDLGVLRGLAAALLHHLTRSSPGPSAELAQTRARAIVDKLAAMRFADLVPPDEEAATLHEADADPMCHGGARGSGSASEAQPEGKCSSADDLRSLRTQLRTLLLEAGLNVPLDLS